MFTAWDFIGLYIAIILIYVFAESLTRKILSMYWSINIRKLYKGD